MQPEEERISSLPEAAAGIRAQAARWFSFKQWLLSCPTQGWSFQCIEAAPQRAGMVSEDLEKASCPFFKKTTSIFHGEIEDFLAFAHSSNPPSLLTFGGSQHLLSIVYKMEGLSSCRFLVLRRMHSHLPRGARRAELRVQD